MALSLGFFSVCYPFPFSDVISENQGSGRYFNILSFSFPFSDVISENQGSGRSRDGAGGTQRSLNLRLRPRETKLIPGEIFDESHFRTFSALRIRTYSVFSM